MSRIKWLNKLLFVENLIGIYRNYCSQNKFTKCFIVFHIFIQTILQTLVVIVQIYLLLLEDLHNQINYIYCALVFLSYIIYILSVVSSICSSRDFRSYFESISRVTKRFEDSKILITSLKKLYWFSITFILLSIIYAVHRSFVLVFNFIQLDYDTYFSYCVPVFLSQSLMRLTILVQKLMFIVVIMIVVILCKCLNLLISVVQERIGTNAITSDEQCDITREQIQEWVELYGDLVNSCEKVTLCFGRQFSWAIMFSISFYILLSYQMCYLSVLNIQDKKIAAVIVMYVLLTIFPIVAGQLVLNQGVKFHRILAQHYNTMVIVDSKKAEAKSIKDFIRLIKNNPLEIKLLSNIPAGTYLLPVILMLSINYIIVLLQINNIV